jgi:acyl carrier protein
MTGAPPEVVPRTAKELSSDYRAPSSAIETALGRVWAEHLHVEPVGVDDNFFELGGHSLLAAELLVAVELEIGVHVPAQTLYLDPTIAAMAAAIDAQESS